MPPHQKLDSYAGMAAQRSTTTQKDMGRGATAGWVKCPLCPPRRMKRYARPRPHGAPGGRAWQRIAPREDERHRPGGDGPAHGG